MDLTLPVNLIRSFEVGMALPTSPTKKRKLGLFSPETSLGKDANFSKATPFGLGESLGRAVIHW